MRVVRDVPTLREDQRQGVVALGSFDGVHRGHLAILDRLAERAQSVGAVAIVADIADSRVGAALGSLRQRVELLSKAKIDVLWLIGSLMRVRHASFEAMAKPFFDGERVNSVIVGAVDATAFSPLLRRTGIPIEMMPPVVMEEVVVTSEAIRKLLAEGDLTGVEKLLGRCYAVSGRVVHGFHRGKGLGFPTANVRVRGLELPPNGVYAVRVRCEARVYDGVANLGLKPTFADVERSLEAHVFDFDGDLYGRFAEVTFVAFLRRERKFPSIQALVEQIRTDCAEARRRLS